MIEVKICGITNINDARRAVESGADALGFIFYPSSPRSISPERARGMIQKLPVGVTKVGIFVNQEVREVKETAAFCGLKLIQLHGDESPRYCSQFQASSLIKAVCPRTEQDVSSLREYSVRAVLMDHREPGRYGGTGKAPDWRLASRVNEIYPLILAGGLNKDNIGEAIEAVRPQAVDINSGVEISPGRKDYLKMREIIEIVRGFSKERGAEDAKIFTG